jgi:hypothetical protein
MKARWFTCLVVTGTMMLLIGPAVAQTAGSGAASPAPTAPTPTPSVTKPAPTPSGTTSIETSPSKGVPGAPKGTDPADSGGASPKATAPADAEQTRSVQQALKDRGMHPGPVDGAMSPETQAAIRAFQKDQKIPVTGRLDSQTREKLGMSP